MPIIQPQEFNILLRGIRLRASSNLIGSNRFLPVAAFPPPTNLNAHAHAENTVWFTRLALGLNLPDSRTKSA